MSDFMHSSAEQAETLLAREKNVMLLDMRDARSYCQGHDPRAIPLNDLTLRTLLKNTPHHVHILICCHDGSASPARAELFADFGFEHCYSLDGGYAAWKARPRQASTQHRAASGVAVRV